MVCLYNRVVRRNRERSGKDAHYEDVDVGPHNKEPTADPRPELEQEHRPNREQTSRKARQERTQKQASAERRDQESYGPARQTLPPANHYQGQQDAGTDEVRKSKQEGAGPQERLIPKEPEALAYS